MHDTTLTPTATAQPASSAGKPFAFDSDLHAEAQAYMARRDEDYGKRGKRYRLSDFATELGISTSYASRYLDGKPNFPVDKLERSLRSILRHEARRRMLVHSLFPTQQSRRLESFAEELKATNSVGLVYGESGSGKSAAVNLYTQANPSTIYIELNRWERTGSEIERMLCEFLDPGDRQRGARARALWLVEHLTDSGRLIVVDDADEATYDALKWLFDFSDKTKVPVMLVGNEDVLRIIRRNPKMFSRLGLFESLEMPDGAALRKQVRTLLDALCPDQAEAIVDLAVAVAERPHGGHLRAVQKRVVMMQTIMAKAAAAGTEAARELAQPDTAFRSADNRLPEPGIERPELRRK